MIGLCRIVGFHVYYHQNLQRKTSFTALSLGKLRAKGEVLHMGSGQRSNTLMVKEAAQAMEQFKYEVANELNINMQPIQGTTGDI